MSMGTIIPLGLTVQQWTDMNALYLSKFGAIPRVENDDWREWAVQLLNLPTIHGINIPSPYQYQDWTEWAHAFNLEMQSVSL